MTPDSEWTALLAWVASDDPAPLDDGAAWPDDDTPPLVDWVE